VLITVEDEHPNAAQILFCVGGAGPGDWRAADISGLARVVMLFDGRDAAMLGAARAAWKNAKDAGHDVTYWKETPSGKFEKQG
jgi:DNA polymerase-3 subunit chi